VLSYPVRRAASWLNEAAQEYTEVHAALLAAYAAWVEKIAKSLSVNHDPQAALVLAQHVHLYLLGVISRQALQPVLTEEEVATFLQQMLGNVHEIT
jgi:hypothetical protein